MQITNGTIYHSRMRAVYRKLKLLLPSPRTENLGSIINEWTNSQTTLTKGRATGVEDWFASPEMQDNENHKAPVEAPEGPVPEQHDNKSIGIIDRPFDKNHRVTMSSHYNLVSAQDDERANSTLDSPVAESSKDSEESSMFSDTESSLDGTMDPIFDEMNKAVNSPKLFPEHNENTAGSSEKLERETTSGHISNDNAVEMGSDILNRPPSHRGLHLGNNQKENFNRMLGGINIVKAYFARGQPRLIPDAKWSDPLLEQLADQMQRYRIAIDVYSAAVKLQRGAYEEVLKSFETMWISMTRGFSDQERSFLKRWIATAQLYQGQYTVAIYELERLLKVPDMDSYAISILVDMADAQACCGHYREALSLITSARKRYEEEKPSSLPSDETKTPIPAGYYEMMSAQDLDDGEEPKLDWAEYAKHGGVPTGLELRDKILQARLSLTESKIYYIGGNFKVAWLRSEEAWRVMLEYMGPEHVNTLECASQYAMCLALNSKLTEANEICDRAIDHAREELGSLHPVTLELLGTRVRIFVMQSRLVEATGVAGHIARDSEKSLDVAHPQTLRLKCLLAEVHLATGHADLAESILENAIVIAMGRGKYGRDMLRLRSALALAKYQLGKNPEAAELAMAAVWEGLNTGHYLAADIRLVEDDQHSHGLRNAKEFPSEHEIKDGVPPSLLQALRTMALTSEKATGTDTATRAQRVFRYIYYRTKVCLGKDSVCALDAKYDLALAYRKTYDDRRTENLRKAVKHLKDVYRKRRDPPGGEHHVDTVSAQRELLCTEYWLRKCGTPNDLLDASKTTKLHSEAEMIVKPADSVQKQDNDETWARTRAEVESLKIYELHECMLGIQHWETQKSLLWLLAIQILRGQKSVANTTLQAGLDRACEESVDPVALRGRLESLLAELGAPSEENPLVQELHLLLRPELSSIAYQKKGLQPKNEKIQI